MFANNRVKTDNRYQIQSKRFGTAIRIRAAELHITLRELAKRCNKHYESTRKVVHGLILPGEEFFNSICKVLKADAAMVQEWRNLIVRDDTERKHGIEQVTTAAPQSTPEMMALEMQWVHLTPDQRASMMQTICRMAEANLRSTKEVRRKRG